MLEYVKVILQKVSFDQSLFEKELLKAIKNLNEEETDLLLQWCSEQFGAHHKAVSENHPSLTQI